jgi:hypothetical protein
MNAFLAAALLLTAAAPRARAEPGRAAALRALASALPEKNPRAGRGSLDAVETVSAEALATCRWNRSEMDSTDRLVRLFDRYLKEDGTGKDALLAAIRRLPDYADLDRDPARRARYRQMELGVRLVPDITRARVVTRGCRALLRARFDAGETRDQLLRALDVRRAALEAAPAPAREFASAP